jgi:methionyl-tRNA formyltransferase
MKVILLGGSSESTLFVYNKLSKSFSIEHVIIEEKSSNLGLLKSRLKRLGLLRVINQILFQTIIVFFLKRLSRSRINEIIEEFKLDKSIIPLQKLIKIKSVNSGDCLNYLENIRPDLVIVNGTRIIRKEVLNSIPCLFINTHTGITPEYRGVHGAYWALVNEDKENCGVTVHKVDVGIDTGDLIKQSKITITNRDNFTTYPYIQIGVGLQLLEEAITLFQNKNLKFYKKNMLNSKLYSHPTFTEYAYNYFIKKVK